jgi:hypothetical protein
MTFQEQDYDETVEMFIENARRQMTMAPTVEEQRGWWARMVYWHKLRTARQVHAMEVSRGIRGSL